MQAKQYSVWWDARLTWNGTADGGCFDEVDFPGKILSELWQPDLFWLGLVEPEVQVQHYFKLRSDGRVLDNKLLFMKLQCDMDLRMLPYDEQTCSIRLGTYRENLAQVRLVFKDSNTPITIDHAVKSLEFTLTSASGNNPLIDISTGTESRLDFSLNFRRDPKYYVWYHFVPVCIIVMCSWLSFFVDRKAVPARATLVLVCLLSTVFRVRDLLAEIPAVPYHVLAADFINMCLFLQVYAVVAFSMGNYLLQVEQRLQAGRAAGKMYYCCLRRNGDMTLKAKHVDDFSRVAYPVAFAVVIGAYVSLSAGPS